MNPEFVCPFCGIDSFILVHVHTNQYTLVCTCCDRPTNVRIEHFGNQEQATGVKSA